MTSGKLTPKADDALRKKLTRRAKEHVALAEIILSQIVYLKPPVRNEVKTKGRS
jgi:hypothetical protein